MHFIKKPYKESHFAFLCGALSSFWLLMYYISDLHLVYKYLAIPILLSIVFFSFVWPVPKFRKQYVDYYYDKRKNLTNEELLNIFGDSSKNNGETIIELLNEVALIFKVPVGKLQPTDRFGVELGGFYVFVNPEIEDMEKLIYKKTNNKALPNFMSLKELVAHIIVS